MDNRRTFLKKGSLALLALSTSASLFPVRVHARAELTVADPRTAAVIWYSQTGNSELIAETFNKKGLNVTASDYRDFDRGSIGTYDLIVAGSPVYYYYSDADVCPIDSGPRAAGAGYGNRKRLRLAGPDQKFPFHLGNQAFHNPSHHRRIKMHPVRHLSEKMPGGRH